jgi:hypothetical protein
MIFYTIVIFLHSALFGIPVPHGFQVYPPELSFAGIPDNQGGGKKLFSLNVGSFCCLKGNIDEFFPIFGVIVVNLGQFRLNYLGKEGIVKADQG